MTDISAIGPKELTCSTYGRLVELLLLNSLAPIQ